MRSDVVVTIASAISFRSGGVFCCRIVRMSARRRMRSVRWMAVCGVLEGNRTHEEDAEDRRDGNHP